MEIPMRLSTGMPEGRLENVVPTKPNVEEWRTDGNLLYTLEHRGGYRKGQPVLSNRLTVNVQASPGSTAMPQEVLDLQHDIHAFLIARDSEDPEAIRKLTTWLYTRYEAAIHREFPVGSVIEFVEEGHTRTGTVRAIFMVYAQVPSYRLDVVSGVNMYLVYPHQVQKHRADSTSAKVEP